jgi:hypothetical protein
VRPSLICLFQYFLPPSKAWQLHNSTVIDGALAFVAPAIQPITLSEGVAFVGVLDVTGKPSKAQTRKNETAVGNIRVLNM